MTFQPVIPLSGIAGWNFLNRTLDNQKQAFDNSSTIQRATDYFSENIATIRTAEDLVNDRRLLEVALGAFGLGVDINNKFFIQKILEDGTLNPEALANRLSDKRYERFSEAFGFGNFAGSPNTILTDFPSEIVSLYQDQEFERAVGDSDNTLRLALAFDREINRILDSDTSNDGRWFQVMGQPPVRQVFEVAFGFPQSFGTLDLDLQLTNFKDKMNTFIGGTEVTELSDPNKREELLRIFLARSSIAEGATSISSASTALTLLQNGSQPTSPGLLIT